MDDSISLRWKFLFPSICLLLALSLLSNAFFIAAGVPYFLIRRLSSNENLKNILRYRFGKQFVPIILGLALVAGLFALLWEDISRVIQISANHAFFNDRDSLALNWKYLAHIFLYLAQPWGGWFFLGFAYGGIILIREKRAYPLIIILFTLLILSLAGRKLGPARIYIYSTPFIFPIGRLGWPLAIIYIVNFLSYPSRIFSIACLTLILFVPSVFGLANHYKNQYQFKGISIAG